MALGRQILQDAITRCTRVRTRQDSIQWAACQACAEVRIADLLQVTNAGGDFQVEVLLLSEVRGPASVAQTLYRETEASREQRLKVAAERKAMKQFEELPAGRPSKRDRRKIIQYRGRAFRRTTS